MKRFLGVAFAAVLSLTHGAARADESDATAVLDKAIKALGGEEKLEKAKAVSWKTKSLITFGENENEFKGESTLEGLDHYRGTFEGEFNGNAFKGVTVVVGDKGWRKFGDNLMDLDDEAVASEKRRIYLQVLPMTLVPLKGKGYKVETAGESKVGDKPAVGLKVTPPDGKPFTIHFDKDSGLPVKVTATVAGFNGEEFEQVTTLSNYKETDGIKRAMKSESKRDGNPFIKQEITEFKVLDKVDADTFAEPK